MNALDGAEKDTSFFPKARMNQLLIVDALEPSGVKPPGKGHLHLVAGLFMIV